MLRLRSLRIILISLVLLLVLTSRRPTIAQTDSITLGFDSLPSAQGWVYTDLGGGFTEGAIYSLGGEALHHNTLGKGSTSAHYEFPDAGVAGLPFSLSVEVKITGYEASFGNPYGFSVWVVHGDQQFSLGISPGRIVGGNTELSTSIDASQTHVYRMEGSPNVGFEVFVDDVSIGSAPFDPLPGTPDFVAMGDGTQGANSVAEVTAFSFTTLIPDFVVDTPSDADLSRCSSAPTDCSLRGAIAAANVLPGEDRITFDADVFETTQTITLGSELPTLSSEIMIDGSAAGGEIIVSGADARRVFYVPNGGEATIKYLTAANGSGGSIGGAIYLENGGQLTLDHATLRDSRGSAGGGGLYSAGGTLTLTDSFITDNYAIYGSGLSNNGSGTMTITRTVFSGNTANGGNGEGGAIFTNSGTITITDSTFTQNSNHLGAGIFAHSGATVHILGSTLSGNTGMSGVAVFNRNVVTITNSTIAGNSAGELGGGIYNNDASSTITLVNATLHGNSAATGGNAYVNAGAVIARNSIVSGALSGNNCFGTITDGGNNLSSDATCDFGAGDNSDPLLDPAGLDDNGGLTETIALQPGSPAIDAGNNSLTLDHNGAPLTTDQRGAGFPRVTGSAVDIGAYELDTFPLLEVDTTSDANLTGCTNLPADCSLRGAITVANGQAGADTITFDAGVFASTQTITLGSLLPNLSTQITLDGSAAGGEIVVSGANARRVFYVPNGGNATIKRVTAAFGNGGSVGGGLYLESGGTLLLDHAVLRDNVGSAGGGALYSAGGSLTLVDSFINFNHATYGSGLSNNGGGAMTISRTRFTGNTADGGNGEGGAIFTNSGTITITDSTFTQNNNHLGAAIFAHTGATVHILGSTISGNTGMSGVAIFNRNIVNVINSTIAGNSAGELGGGIYNNDPSATTTLVNATVNGNAAGISGGNLYVSAGTIIARNSIVSAPLSGVNCVGLITDGGNNLSTDATCGFGTGNSTNPLLDPAGLQNNGGLTQTIALQSGSPAVNGGNNALALDHTAAALTTDQRGAGFPRILNGTVDIGAFESTFSPIPAQVNGFVRQSNGSTPIPGAQVYFMRYSPGGALLETLGPASADGGGFYSMFVPTGTYRIRAVASGYIEEFYSEAPSVDLASVMDIPAGGMLTNLNFTLSAPAVVQGTVYPPQSFPPPSWYYVRYYRRSWFFGASAIFVRQSLTPDYEVQTDANGNYTLPEVAPGTYVVEIYSDEYGAWYFDGASTLNEADEFSVGEGETLTGIDVVTQGGPVKATVEGTASPQGHPAAPHASWIQPLHVVIKPSGGGSAVFDETVMSDDSGNFTVTLIEPGSYRVWVKGPHSLANAVTVTLAAGDNTVNLGLLLEGDADNSNSVILTDFSLLAASFGKAQGQAGYDERADFNDDNVVNLIDFSLLASNFGKPGALP